MWGVYSTFPLTTKSTAATLNNISLDLFYIGFQHRRAHSLIKVLATSSVIRSADGYGERITSTDSILTCSASINLEALPGSRSAHSAPPLMPGISCSIFRGRPESLAVCRSPAVTRAYTGQS